MESSIVKPKKTASEFAVGNVVKVHHIIKEKDTKRIQIFEGIVISKRGQSEPGASFTVRKISQGIGVEKVFPLFSPFIEKVEVIRKNKVRRAKLYYLRKAVGKNLRLKEKK